MSDTKHPGGRPTKYKPELCIAAKALARLGLIDTEIAAELGIAESTFYGWKEKYPEFTEAIKAGKDEPDDKVERALFELATGYEFDAEKPMVVSDGKDTGAHVEIAQYREKIAPNATAIIFWLKNRRPKSWRDKQEIEHSGAVNLIIDDDDAKL